MNNKIKNKAQEVYPVTEKAECYTAFLQGANSAKKEVIEYTIKWLENIDYDMVYWNFENGFLKERFIRDFKEAISTDVLI